MSWVAVAVGVGTAVVGGVAQNRAAKKAANAQNRATDASIEEQRRQFDLTRQDHMPWLDAGKSALGRLNAASTGDFSNFYRDPSYQFTLDQGIQGLDRGAAARGRLYSGGHDADRIRFASGLASQEYGNWWNRQAGLAQVGQAATSNIGSLGMGMANNISGLLMQNGQARASSYLNQGNNYAQMAGGIGGLLNYGYQSNRAANGGGTGWYFGKKPGRD